MAEPFKNLLNPGLVRELGSHLERAWTGFPRASFVREATRGLEALELKARAAHIARALEEALPPAFARAVVVLERSLAPADDRAEWKQSSGLPGVAGWAVWPMTEFVAARGLGEPARALQALHAMTQRFTAEWAIRPFLLEHPGETFATLRSWVADPSPHVRRLVSEGSRPRLPWGVQLKPLIADPSPTLPLLAALQDDPSEYVRRSVANHLNDIAKDHPRIVAEWLERHLPGASAQRRALLQRASRTLVKRGDQRVLQAWGIGRRLQGDATLRVSPRRARIGGEVLLTATLRSTSAKPQQLAIDYAVHRVLADGSTSPKVWKGWVIELGARESRTLTKRRSLRPVSTRRDHPGRHAVDLVINGVVAATSEFDLRR